MPRDDVGGLSSFLLADVGELDCLASFFGEIDLFASLWGDSHLFPSLQGDIDLLASFRGETDCRPGSFFGDIDLLLPSLLLGEIDLLPSFLGETADTEISSLRGIVDD